ncbi:MAG: hypothetical protein U5K72_12535 [Balneolaceae bacterium]|nr:hypothetical protein [Balneolaceae bacterium]
MKKSCKPLFYLCILILFYLPRAATGQVPENTEADTLNGESAEYKNNSAPFVYIDCSFCDFDYIRSELPFVNYVRDPEQADIHIFITRTSMVSGATEYEISFIGQRTFSDIQFDLKYVAQRNATTSEIRDGLNKVLFSALMPYLSQTSLFSSFNLMHEPDGLQATELETPKDPWNYWIFEAYVGSISLGLESNRTDFDSRWGIFADRVTEDWKLRFRPYFNYTYVEIEQSEDEDVKSSVQRHGLDTYAIKSINQHWSVGLFADYITRNDRNIRHRVEISPGIEYSFFPYRLATRKAVTLQYQIGYSYFDFFDTTIFNKNSQHLLGHQFRGAVDVEQPWGSISGGLIGSHYFHDTSLRRAEFFGGFSVRIFEGLSVRFQTNFQMIQDQITLPAGDASLEDILLQRRELATDFSLSGSFAVTYTFGSEFANIVNTRF